MSELTHLQHLKETIPNYSTMAQIWYRARKEGRIHCTLGEYITSNTYLIKLLPKR